MLDAAKLELYHSVLEKAVSQQERIEETINQIMKRGIKNIYLVGAGGSLAVMYPCKHVMEQHSHLMVEVYNPGEFLTVRPINLTKDSLVVLSSYSGKTPETVEAAARCRELGCPTIGFVGEADTPLGQAVDHVFANKADEGTTDSKLIMLYQIIFNILRHTDAFTRYDEFMTALKTLPDALVAVRKKAEPTAVEFAKAKKDVTFFMTLGSGPCWGEAYAYAVCILQEMQWILAEAVPAGEFFHGSFEIVTEDTELILFKGVDVTRPLTDRVERFANKYTKKLTIIDAKDYELPGVAADFAGYFSPLVLSAAVDVYSKNLALERDHPLKTRRYMGMVDY